MAKTEKLLAAMRNAPQNIAYDDLLAVCVTFFGEPRQRGTSHTVAGGPEGEHPAVKWWQGQGVPGASGAQGHRQVAGGAGVTNINHYAYRVVWSAEDGAFVATVAEFPSLSWLHPDQAEALRGLVDLVADVVSDLEANGEAVPEPISERRFSGRFNVRIPESLHRELALSAAQEGVSLNRLISDRLARG
jgi:predicted HicB family RNase H-like nuclease